MNAFRNKSFLLIFLFLPFLLPAQVKDWQGFSENNEVAALEEIIFKDKKCFKMDGKNQVIAINNAKKYENFRIELDIAAMTMSGVGFHVKNEQNYQFIYFRPGYGNTQEAIQYIPVYNGALSWVLYHYPQYEAKTNISPLEWFHAAIEVRNKKLKVFVNGNKEPEMSLTLLDSDTKSGPVLLRTMFGESYYANIQIRELPGPAMTDWEISEQLPRDVSYDYSHLKKVKAWTRVDSGTDEMVNINRYFTYPNGAILARRKLVTESDKTQSLYFDFVGKLKIYLNGKEVFNYAKNKLERLSPDTYAVSVDLKKGDNELVFVSEGDASVFGKGFNAMGRFQHQNWAFTAFLY